MKVPMKIRKSMATLLDLEEKKGRLISDIYEWIEKQGIDTFSLDFADTIGARLQYSEFDSVDELINDLKRFKSGEDVGYG